MAHHLRFIANPASGAGLGQAVADRLVELAGPAAVFRLDSQPLPALLRPLAGQACALIACGGDGTAVAVAEAAHRLWPAEHLPPIGILALGTGNDLARVLGCPRCRRLQDLPGLVAGLEQAAVIRCDRWRLQGGGQERTWYNYLGFGFDGQVVQQVHAWRQRHPFLFRQRWLAKSTYAIIAGLARPPPLAGRLLADGLTIPATATGLVLASIRHYSGGGDLGPHVQPDDGRFDAFCLRGLVDACLAARTGRRPAFTRRDRLSLRLTHPLPAQIDGEPLPLAAGDYVIQRAGTTPFLNLGSTA